MADNVLPFPITDYSFSDAYFSEPDDEECRDFAWSRCQNLVDDGLLAASDVPEAAAFGKDFAAHERALLDVSRRVRRTWGLAA